MAGKMRSDSVPLRCPSSARAAHAAVVAALAMFSAGTASPQGLKVAPTPAPAAEGELAEAEPLYAAPTRADRSGRIHASVLINGMGPYRFILDTGANTSALAPKVSDELALQGVNDTQIIVHGVTGSATLPAVRVESLQAGDVRIPATNLPVLPGPVFGGADGILGINALQKTRIEVDFENDRVSITPSSGRRALPGYLVVPATLRKGGLLLVKGKVGKVPVQVIIDTGAERTLGNMALRTALLERARYDDEIDVSVLGATTEVSEGKYFRAPRITLGEADLIDLPVTFGELHVFEVWGLTDTPALVIGMDLLGMLRKFIVDYKRREFQLRSYDMPGTDVRMNRCIASRCDSRIPSNN
jgi:predicted aspartyl protease